MHIHPFIRTLLIAPITLFVLASCNESTTPTGISTSLGDYMFNGSVGTEYVMSMTSFNIRISSSGKDTTGRQSAQNIYRIMQRNVPAPGGGSNAIAVEYLNTNEIGIRMRDTLFFYIENNQIKRLNVSLPSGLNTEGLLAAPLAVGTSYYPIPNDNLTKRNITGFDVSYTVPAGTYRTIRSEQQSLPTNNSNVLHFATGVGLISTEIRTSMILNGTELHGVYSEVLQQIR
ncbi:MAG: hypothetical protein JNL32_02555 [Candidatus Kapabacteria bacterium]|nr:hypothetical protein [Candidatus Kapabacteria bacterium]